MPSILNGRVRAVQGVCACFLALSLSPVAAQSPRIQATPSVLDFGEVFLGDSATLTIELKNVGGAPLEITSVEVGGSGSDDFTTAAIVLPPTVAPGGLLLFDSY